MGFNFNKHVELEGKHAELSPSQSHVWTKQGVDKLCKNHDARQIVLRGTKLHAMAKDLIDEKIKQVRNKNTFNSYVNDAIGYGMDTEVTLYYSGILFGTADAISFDNNFLRIHDLKTGTTPAHMEQLMTYAALFCHEYNVKPEHLKGCELRIYQNNEILVFNPTVEELKAHMDSIFEKEQGLKDYIYGRKG